MKYDHKFAELHKRRSTASVERIFSKLKQIKNYLKKEEFQLRQFYLLKINHESIIEFSKISAS